MVTSERCSFYDLLCKYVCRSVMTFLFILHSMLAYYVIHCIRVRLYRNDLFPLCWSTSLVTPLPDPQLIFTFLKEAGCWCPFLQNQHTFTGSQHLICCEMSLLLFAPLSCSMPSCDRTTREREYLIREQAATWAGHLVPNQAIIERSEDRHTRRNKYNATSTETNKQGSLLTKISKLTHQEELHVYVRIKGEPVGFLHTKRAYRGR